ncbi:MAG: S-adenosylmethionine:tRNA ribosyltransferase-isomerase, partial [Chloroflexales bacterium]
SAAAPTAGFHFTPQVLERLRARGVLWEELTLHVGLGTFRPVKAADLRAHVMHEERYRIETEVAERINAARRVQGAPAIILRRDQAYIGVPIDDLVTKAIHEPYRMFTSRAEHRLLLRGDNADLRLTPLAYELGLVDAARAAAVEARRSAVAELRAALAGHRIFPSAAVNARLEAVGVGPLSQPASAAELLARPLVRYGQLREALGLPVALAHVAELVEVECKYGGYIVRQQREVARLRKMEDRRIPADLDYAKLAGLRNEARQVLGRFRPATLGQASRLAGINPADVAIVLFALERRRTPPVAPAAEP